MKKILWSLIFGISALLLKSQDLGYVEFAINAKYATSFVSENRTFISGKKDFKTFPSPNGQFILNANSEWATIFDVLHRDTIISFPISEENSMIDFVWNDKGTRIYCAHENAMFSVIDATSGGIVSSFNPFAKEESITALSLSDDGQKLAIGTKKGSVIVVDLLKQEIILNLDAHRRRITCLDWSVDGQDIISSSNDKRINIISLSKSELKNQIKSPSGSTIISLKYAHNGETVTIIDECGKIYNIDGKTLSVLQKQEFEVDCSTEKSTCVSKHDAFVFIGFRKNILVYDRATLEPLTIIKGFEFEVSDLKVNVNENKVYVIDESGLSYVSRIGQGATVIEDLNQWLSTSPEKSIGSLSQSNAIKRLFTTDNFALWVQKNPLLFPLLKTRSQFETESEFNKRFSLGIELLVDQLVMTSDNDMRMNNYFDYLSRMEVANSRKPVTIYPRDFELLEYDITTGVYTIFVQDEYIFEFEVNRDRAKQLFDNIGRCVIECIEQKNLKNNSREYINLKLINRDLGQEFVLTEFIDLLDLTDKSTLPPEIAISDISLTEEDGRQQLAIELSNKSEGNTSGLILELVGPDKKYRTRYKLPDLNGFDDKTSVIKNSESIKSLDWNYAYLNILEKGGYQITSIPINFSNIEEVSITSNEEIVTDERKIGHFEFDINLKDACIEWNTDGRYFLMNHGSSIEIWDVISRQSLRKIKTDPYTISHISWDVKDLNIICVDSKGNCLVYDADKGELLYQNDLNIPNDIINIVADRENTLHVADNKGFLYQINYSTGNQIGLRRLLESDVLRTFISPNNSQIAVITDEEVSTFNMKTGREYWRLENNNCINDITWNSAENMMLIAVCDSLVNVVESLNGKTVRSLKERTEGFLAAKWSDFGNYVATITKEGELVLWHGNTGVPFERFESLDSNSSTIYVNPTGKLIISQTDNSLSFWSAGEFIEVLESVTQSGIEEFSDLAAKDSLLSAQINEYSFRSERNQFETDYEYDFRLMDENLLFAKQITAAKARIRQQLILNQLRKTENIQNSRRLAYLDISSIELGRYNMYTEMYPIKYDGQWYDIKLDRNEARQLYKYSENAKIRVIAQLDSTLTDTVYINPSLIHANGKEFAIGEQRKIEGGLYSNVLPPKLVLKSLEFIDNDGDKILSAGESGRIKLEIANEGEGDARFLRILTKSNIVSYDGLNSVIDEIENGQTTDLYIELSPNDYLLDSIANISLSFVEANGFSLDTIALSFKTKSFKAPNLKLADFAVSDNDGRPIISSGELIDVTLRFANFGEGPANSVGVRLTSGENVFIVGAPNNTLMTELGSLKPGEVKDYQFQAFCNNQAKAFIINYAIRDKSDNPFSDPKDIGLVLNKEVKGIKQLIFEEEAFVDQSGKSFKNELLDDLPEALDTNENAIVVIIGNKNYRGNMPPVEYALNDAYTIQEYFKAYLGVKPGNIILKEDATLSEMKVLFGDKDNVEGRLKDLIRPGKTELYVYYSGHGAPDLKSSRGFLMPTDANPSRLSLTAFAMDDLIKNLSLLKTKKSTLIVDACFSGGISTGDYLVKNASSLGLKVKSISDNLSSNISIMTASADDQVASWYSEKRHGLFTYFLLKGMKGAADLNNDRVVTYDELKAYIKDADNGVPYKARELYSREQTPIFLGKNAFNISIPN
jgi:WD40 repeat protein